MFYSEFENLVVSNQPLAKLVRHVVGLFFLFQERKEISYQHNCFLKKNQDGQELYSSVNATNVVLCSRLSASFFYCVWLDFTDKYHFQYAVNLDFS